MTVNKNETWTITENDSAGVVKISGEVDFSSSPQLRQMLHDFIQRTKNEVGADLGELEYLDSSGLAVLIEARRLLQEQGRTMKITDITPEVRKIFELTQVGQLFGL